MSRSAFHAAATGLISLGLLLPGAVYIGGHIQPRRYTSSVTLEVMEPGSLSKVLSSPANDPSFIPDQIQILQSTTVLYPVIDELELDKKFSAAAQTRLTKEAVYEMIKAQISVSRKPDSNMLTLSVWDADRQEAADISNTIAVIYQKVRNEDLQQAASGLAGALQAQADKLKAAAEAAKAEADKIRAHDNVTDPDPEGKVFSAESIAAGQVKLESAKQAAQQLQDRFTKFNNLSFDEQLAALPQLNVHDVTITELLPKYTELSPTEPRKAELKKQLEQALDGIKANLQSQLAAQQQIVQSEQPKVDEAQAYASSIKDYDYLTAREKYTGAAKLAAEAQQKYSDARAEARAGYQVVKIWSRAVPAMIPDSPRYGSWLTTSAGIGVFLILCGGALLVVGGPAREEQG